jgi:hypothetical protein
MTDEHHEIKGGNTRGHILDLGNHDASDIIYGGAFLHNCVINIRGSSFRIEDANMLNCRINAEHPVTDVRFLEAVFENCTFEGMFSNCSFGYCRGASQTPNAYYRKCNLTGATMDECEFYIGDPDSTQWPSWPNITILNPRRNLQNWNSIAFSSDFKELQDAVSRVVLTKKDKEKPGADDEPLAISIDLTRYTASDLSPLLALMQSKKFIKFTETSKTDVGTTS